jgi:ABC-2 type transport system permease protein
VNHTRSTIRLVARREIRDRLQAKSFFVVTGLLVVLIVAIGGVYRLVGDDEAESVELGVSDPVPAGFAEAAAQAAVAVDREVTVTPIGAADARRALEDGDIDAAVLTGDRRVVYDDEIDAETQAIVQQAWSGVELQEALTDAGVSAARTEDIVSAEPLEATTLEGDEDDTGLAVLTGTVTAVLLFISLQIFGNYALTGVAEEKSSAVVELLLVRVRADQLLAGKLLGIGVVASLQFAAAVLAAMVALAISGVDVPDEIWSALPMAVVWYLGGFALYSTLYALAGSLVSRQEDAPAAAAPIVTVLIAAYVMIYIFGYVPESTASRVLSVIPPVAPFLMPMRMAAGAASVVEVVLALVLLVATTVVVWKLAGRVYEQVLLRRGSRIPWREALALLQRS